MSLFVAETGTAGAPALVLLHGVGASGWMWWQQTPALAGFHCLNVDLPGHGQSHEVEWVSLADTADQIAALIEARAANGRAHVVGLSLGGYVTLRLLERHPNRVLRAVISGVTAAPMPNRSLARPQVWLMAHVIRRRGVAQRQARALGLPPEMQTAFTDNLRRMSMQAYRRIVKEAAYYRVPSALGQVETPTLITAGSRESAIILDAVKVIPNLMPRAEGVLAVGYGHGWNVEAPALFTAMVRAWISGAPLPAGLRRV